MVIAFVLGVASSHAADKIILVDRAVTIDGPVEFPRRYSVPADLVSPNNYYEGKLAVMIEVLEKSDDKQYDMMLMIRWNGDTDRKPHDRHAVGDMIRIGKPGVYKGLVDCKSLTSTDKGDARLKRWQSGIDKLVLYPLIDRKQADLSKAPIKAKVFVSMVTAPSAKPTVPSEGIAAKPTDAKGTGRTAVSMVVGSKELPLQRPYPVLEGYKEVSSVLLRADGPRGTDTYKLISQALGTGPETPDKFGDNHPGVKHIVEETDLKMGDYFKFILHRDIDGDRSKGRGAGKQRNEVKVDGKKERCGRYGDIVAYQSRFKLSKDFKTSKSFSHIWQIKSQKDVSGYARASLNATGSNLYFMYGGLKKLYGVKLSEMRGEWVECQIVICLKDGEEGWCDVSMIRMRDGKELLKKRDANDWWRGDDTENGDYLRAKWGMYRRISDSLNKEESLCYADIRITKLKKK